jgi:sulfur-oxidizing protein SoxX
MRRLAVLVSVLLCGCAEKDGLPRQIAGADPAKGLAAMEQTGCASCHAIPGIDWPRGAVGGALAGFGARPLIAGHLPNRPDLLVQWVRDAPSLAPQTAMPAMPLSPAQARDVAAYLYTLDD